jgi:putative flippase GtrA
MKIFNYLTRLGQLFRYYQAGLINMAFGFSLYAILVAAGLNIYVSQVVSHVLGMAFNYFIYTNHVFRDTSPAKLRFVISYGVNYLISVGSLFAVSSLVKSPYIAGLIVVFGVSLLNYFLLKKLVFIENR